MTDIIRLVGELTDDQIRDANRLTELEEDLRLFDAVRRITGKTIQPDDIRNFFIDFRDRIKAIQAAPETKKAPPIPNRRDLVLIDGQFAQCCASSPRGAVTFRLVENQSEGIRINPEEWSQYEYTEPPADMICARQLVEKGLMSEEQLEKVFWGPGEEKNPYLKGVVTFFGTYTKKK